MLDPSIVCVQSHRGLGADMRELWSLAAIQEDQEALGIVERRFVLFCGVRMHVTNGHERLDEMSFMD